MLRFKSGSVEWLEFEHLHEESHIRHAIFLRHGGVSPQPFTSLNAGGKVGDSRENISINQEKMRQIIGCRSFFASQQVHGDVVAIVPSEGLTVCDGIITEEAGLGLMINHADCQVALIYDPVKKVIANVHAGWRGQVQNIYGKAVLQLKAMGCRPENLLVGISPSLGSCCAEFKNYEQELPPAFWSFQVRPLYFDLWGIAHDQFTKAGVLDTHLQMANICTKCNTSDFFSYRGERETGRNGTVIALQT